MNKVDTGFKVFEMIDNPAMIMKEPLSSFTPDMFSEVEKILKESDHESLVYTYMLSHGFSLNEKVETLIPNVLYQVHNELFLFKEMDKEELNRILKEKDFLSSLFLYVPTLDKDKFTLEIQKFLIIEGHEKKIKLLK